MSSKKLLLRQIYLYLICLVSVVAFLVIGGDGLWGVVEMASPQLTISEYDYKIVSSYEHFKTAWPKMDRVHPGAEIEIVDDDELRRKYEDERRLILDAERRHGLREFIRMWVWMIIIVPIYLFHWRTARRLKSEPGEADTANIVRSTPQS
ncbi:hypothetical protein ACFLQW_03555 [Candidatus Zixiibacteriota bacterium]